MRPFLEFAVASDDVMASLSFYRAIGFTEHSTADALPHPYAVVGDGRITIGLHTCDEPLPALRYVQPDVQKTVLDWSERGIEFESLNVDIDDLHRVTLVGPFQNRIGLIEARTFSPMTDVPHNSRLGEFDELSLPVQDVVVAAHFWAPHAAKVTAQSEDPPYMRLSAGGLPLALCSGSISEPTVSFVNNDLASVQSACDSAGIATGPAQSADGNPGLLLRAPEGTALAVFAKATNL